MQTMLFLKLLCVMVVTVVSAGCIGKCTSPKWNVRTLEGLASTDECALKWIHDATTVSNGMSRTGYATKNGARQCDEWHAQSTNLVIDLVVTRYRDIKSCQDDFDRLRNATREPVYDEGRSCGFSYTVSKSLQPQADAGGGGEYIDKRVTRLWIQKNVTYVWMSVATEGANVTVDIDMVVRCIDTLVRPW